MVLLRSGSVVLGSPHFDASTPRFLCYRRWFRTICWCHKKLQRTLLRRFLLVDQNTHCLMSVDSDSSKGDNQGNTFQKTCQTCMQTLMIFFMVAESSSGSAGSG